MQVFSTFLLFGNLIIDPLKTWQTISSNEQSVKALFYKFFSVIVLCASLLAFTGVFINTGRISMGLAQLVNVFVSMFVGMYFAGKLLVLTATNFMPEVIVNKIFQWVIYSGSVFVFCHGLAQLFTPFSFLNQVCLLLELYFIRLLWVGIKMMLPVSDNKKIGYVFLAGMFILVLPLICERILSVFFEYIFF